MLLFVAGFEEIRMEEILKHKTVCSLVGFFGSIVPFVLGYLLSLAFGYDNLSSIFIGAALMATSISISIGSLIGSRKLNTKFGRITLGGAIVDDIIALIALAIIVNIGVYGHFPTFMEFGRIILGMALFFAIFVLCGYVFPKLIKWSRFMIVEEAKFSVVLVLVLLLAFSAEKLGLSTVLGAFLAGVILSRVPELETRSFISKINVTSEGIFIPLFFSLIGLELYFSFSVFSVFTLLLILVAILSKVIPSYLVGRFSKLNKFESLAMGIAMAPRGEVALIIVLLGKELGFINDVIFSSIFMLIIITTFIVPFSL